MSTSVHDQVESIIDRLKNEFLDTNDSTHNDELNSVLLIGSRALVIQNIHLDRVLGDWDYIATPTAVVQMLDEKKDRILSIKQYKVPTYCLEDRKTPEQVTKLLIHIVEDDLGKSDLIERDNTQYKYKLEIYIYHPKTEKDPNVIGLIWNFCIDNAIKSNRSILRCNNCKGFKTAIVAPIELVLTSKKAHKSIDINQVKTNHDIGVIEKYIADGRVTLDLDEFSTFILESINELLKYNLENKIENSRI